MDMNSKHFGTRLVVPSLMALALTAGMSALATETLTFNGLQDQEPIDNYYDGGLGGLGSGPGPNYGITFTSDSLAIIANSAGGSGNFENAPSGNTVAFFLTGAGDTMNMASGFNTGFSFYYSSDSVLQSGSPGSVTVWSGLNGTGTLLGTLSLPDTGNNGPAGALYNTWDPVGVSFGGTAESAIFSGAANYIAFDNITLGASVPTPPSGVPDGGGLGIDLIAGLALAGAAFVARKQASSC
jgi:hypothetical protein